jgi:hypothetical protein
MQKLVTKRALDAKDNNPNERTFTMKNKTLLGIVLTVVIAGTIGSSCRKSRTFLEKSGGSASLDAAPVLPEGRKVETAPKKCDGSLPQLIRQEPQSKTGGFPCRVVASLKFPSYTPAPQINISDHGFEVWQKVSRNGSEGLALQRYKADGTIAEPEIFWNAPASSSGEQMIPGHGSSLWIAPDDGKDTESHDSWKLGCVKNKGPERLVRFKGKYPLATWHRDRFVVVAYADGALRAIVSEPGCGFRNGQSQRVGSVQTPLRNADGENEDCPFISELVSTDDTVGVLLMKTAGSDLVIVKLATFKLEGNALKPVARIPVALRFRDINTLMRSTLSSTGRRYLVQVLGTETAARLRIATMYGSSREIETRHELYSSTKQVSFLVGNVVDHVANWNYNWYRVLPTESGYSFECTSCGFFDSIEVSKHSAPTIAARVIGNGHGLFMLEENIKEGKEGIFVRPDDDDDDSDQQISEYLTSLISCQ